MLRGVARSAGHWQGRVGRGVDRISFLESRRNTSTCSVCHAFAPLGQYTTFIRRNNRVQLFDAKTREFMMSFGRRGNIKPGLMEGPEGVSFVDGRQEIIVADTGNNRLQIFHVGQLTIPPRVLPKVVNSDSENGIGVNSSRGGPVSSTATNHEPSPTARSWMAWAQAQAPVRISAREAKLEGPGEGPSHEINKRTNFRGQMLEIPGGEVKTDDDHANKCMFIFYGGKDIIGSLRKRRTAGESEVGEGPLSQPCDLSFWKARRAEEDTPLAWDTAVPPWFRFWSGSSTTTEDAKSLLRAEPLKGPKSQSSSQRSKQRTVAEGSLFSRSERGTKHPAAFKRSSHTKRWSKGQSGSVLDAIGWEDSDETPVAGSFVICESGNTGDLQLFFVDKTKDAFKAEEAWKSEQNANEKARLASPKRGVQESKDLSGTRGSGEEEGGNEEDSILSLPNTQEYEVRCKTIKVLDGARQVVIDGRTYGSLLILLRALRGRSFARLPGVFDTRGERGIVAVAERGGGRVRLLHYVPAFPPFYQTELTHFHSIEGLLRPCSVSFNREGDLVIADDGAKKVIVYGYLSGRWVRVHDFGPAHVGGIKFEMCTNIRERRGWASAATVQKRDPKRQTAKGEELEWAGGVPVSSRFTLGGVDLSAVDSLRGNVRSTTLVVASSDGVVRTLVGPVQRNCGLFAGLHEDMVLSIFEILGYRSSQVLRYVNRTTAVIRAKLRREWRLFPLTQGYFAKIKLEFLRWGRSSTGQGLPGRGTAVDASGVRLCNNFPATSKCSRLACPYSHEQPWIENGFLQDDEACILFRGGVTHVLNNLHGQVFVWEWEGDLYRLFCERSISKTLVNRRDPLTLGMYGAEVIRKCVEEEQQVLGYSGFIDFVTVIQEHVMGLRSWNRRSATLPTTSIPETIQEARKGIATLSSPRREGFVSLHERALPRPTQLGNDVEALVKKGINAAACVVKSTKQDIDGKEEGLMLYEARGSDRSPSGFCLIDPATPWLSWDSAWKNVDRSPTTVPYSLCDEHARFGRKEAEEDEEAKVNRTYGSNEDERAVSVNRIVAFQTDRVIRVLDRLF